MLTPDQISELADRFQIDPLSVIREYLQVLFLAHLSRNPGAAHWHFKGGTAIRLLGNSFRFSEDLNFTVTSSRKEASLLVHQVIPSIQQEIPEVSYRHLQHGSESMAGQIRYPPPSLKYPLAVRLQCSLRERPRLPKTSLLETVYPVPYPWIRHLDWPEILAETVRALLIRSKGRDLFDLWFLLTKGIPLDWPLIRFKMRLYRRSASLKDLVSAIERMEGDRLVQEVGPFLPKEHRRLPLELKSRVLERLAHVR